MRWRFNGDTCCACGGSTFNCCIGSVTTYRDENYIDSLTVRRQRTDLVWEDREAVITPIQMFATGIQHPTTAENWTYPCAASNCKWDAPGGVVTDYGTGEWDQTFEFGSYDSLLSEWAWKFNRDNNASMFGAFGLYLPLNNLPQECNPAQRMTFKAGQPNDADYWKKVSPPNMDAFLAATTWDIQMGDTPLWDTWGSVTFRFPHLTNYCWPARGGTGGVSYCNFANATFSNGVYFASGSGANQSGSQSWTYSATDQESYLEVPFGGNTLQFRPSTAAGEEDILYMHLNGGFFYAEKFSVAGTCNGSVTWTSLNNPSNYVTFDITGGDSCNECGEQTPIVSGCCVLADGTVDPYSNSTACAAAGGTYSGDDSVCPPTGCCQILGSADESGVTEAYCTTQGGSWTQGVECGTGWCMDNATGLVIPGIEQDECEDSGANTWFSTEPTMGCCDISGTEHPNVAEQWCTTQSGTFTAGDCPTPPLGWCINDTTGAITANVLEANCTGTWSATEPASGCCEISGTNHPDVAQSWCTTQSGTFTAGECPPSTFDPCAETFSAVANSITLDMNDPNFDCASPLSMYTPTWYQGSAFVDHDACSPEGVKLIPIITTEIYGDSTAEPSTLSPVTKVTAKYNSVSDTWAVTLYVQWSYNSNTYTVTASKSNLSNSGFDCPSFTLSGSFDTFTGNYTQLCSGDLRDVTDLIGSFNITLTCEPEGTW